MHTPGPWEARDVAGAGWQIYAKVGEWNDQHCSVVHFTPLGSMTIHAKKDGTLVGMIAYESWVQFKSRNIAEQWAGNAKLAAAAPELLEATKALLALCADYLSPEAKAHHAVRLDQAAAALRKAEEGTEKPNLSLPYWAEGS